MRLFVRKDPVLVRERQRDIVETLEQTLLLERLDLEMRRPSEIVGHGLLFEIDREPVRLVIAGGAKNMLDLGGRQRDRKKAVLQTVVVEDIGELRRDHRAEARVIERPHRMLSRTAASKIVARDQNRRALVARLVQREIFVLGAVGIEPPVDEQPLLEAGPHYSLQKLLGDDLIGIDVGAIERRDHPGEILECLHFCLLRTTPATYYHSCLTKFEQGRSPASCLYHWVQGSPLPIAPVADVD